MNRPLPKLREIIQEIRSDIGSVEQDEALNEEVNFIARAEAIDFIEFYVIDRIEGILRVTDRVEELNGLKRRAELVKNRLEGINGQLFRKLRERIRTGHYTGAALKNQLDRYVQCISNQRDQDEIGYDSLDTFVNGLLQVDAVAEETKEREPEMVFYQPTPARITLELIEKAHIKPDDVFYDLGSGLGQVLMLVNLLSGAKAKGIEFEPAYCNYARQCARRLNLKQVEFINLDVRDVDYSDGTIFFMYTPFKGKLLGEVLEKLRAESQGRAIKICTYGPCTPHVSKQKWLRPITRNVNREYELAIFKNVKF
jgi:hypothetical protein